VLKHRTGDLSLTKPSTLSRDTRPAFLVRSRSFAWLSGQGGFGDEAGVVEPGGAELLLAAGGRGLRPGVLDIGEPGDDAGVEGVGFFRRPCALREAAHGTEVEDGHADALLREQGKGPLFLAAGGFHGHPFVLMGMAKGSPCGDTLGGVGEGAGGSLLADAGLQRG